MRLYVVSRPTLDINEVVRFLNDENVSWRRTEGTSESDEIIELAGRICYMSFGNLQSPRSNTDYIKNLIVQGHESVLEHVTWSFILTGISRGFSHQLVRHRIGFSYSQLSQQYYDESYAEFVLPDIIKHSKRAMEKWKEITKNNRESYKELLEYLKEIKIDGLSKKELNRLLYTAARSVLPNATETKIFVTANARSIRHFLKVRGAIQGDEEMRRVSAELLKVVTQDAKALFSDFHIEYLKDGSPIVIHNNGGN
ncbi:FAD-dependent thymidylate synthase [Nibrella saemangeumensis]|uniref:Flavin-dependent thymidylate synthase n=1 Tax=Nibrella saemangeumensis TaxID=1084526 RepID=A0ABP8N7I8_9BACT